MAIRLVKTDQMVRVITLQNETDTTVTGVSSVLLTTTNPFPKDKQVRSVRYEGAEATNMANGKTFNLDSYILGASKFGDSYLSFKDGVIDVDFYVNSLPDDSVTLTSGTAGTDYIVGTGLLTIWENYTSIIIGSEVYQIDKSTPTNGGTTLFLMNDLKEDITSSTVVEVANRDNLKLKNDFRTKCIIAKSVSLLTRTGDRRFKETEEAVLKVIRNKVACEASWELGDYSTVSTLLNENIMVGEYLGILKGGNIWGV